MRGPRWRSWSVKCNVLSLQGCPGLRRDVGDFGNGLTAEQLGGRKRVELGMVVVFALFAHSSLGASDTGKRLGAAEE